MGLEFKVIWANCRDYLKKKGFHSTKKSLQHSGANKQSYKDWMGNIFLHLVVP